MACAASATARRPGTADLIHGKRGGGRWHAAVKRRLPRRILAQPCLQDAAHDAFVNFFGPKGLAFTCNVAAPRKSLAGAPYCFRHHQRPQPRRSKRLQRSLELSYRRTHRRNNHCFPHCNSPASQRAGYQPGPGASRASGTCAQDAQPLDDRQTFRELRSRTLPQLQTIVHRALGCVQFEGRISGPASCSQLSTACKTDFLRLRVACPPWTFCTAR